MKKTKSLQDLSLNELKLATSIEKKRVHSLEMVMNIIGSKPAIVAAHLLHVAADQDGKCFVNQSMLAKRLCVSSYTINKATKLINKIPCASFKNHFVELHPDKMIEAGGDANND